MYLPDDGKNFEDKTKRTTEYKFTHEIKAIDVLHLWIFQKGEIALTEAARENLSFLKKSRVQIDSKLNSKPYDYLHIMPCNM